MLDDSVCDDTSVGVGRESGETRVVVLSAVDPVLGVVGDGIT